MKHRPGARIAVAVLAAVLCALALATPAAAHVKSGAPPVTGTQAPVALWLPALLLAVVALAWRRPRRAVALALVLILAAFAFDIGVHSVHHLGDQERVRDCAVASAAAHVPADTGAAFEVAPALAASTERAASPGGPSLRSLARSPGRGRAPPHLPA
jgi:hypothetical protein